MKKTQRKSAWAGLRRFWIVPATLGCLCRCGQNVGPLTGGASEIGNPNAAIYQSGKEDTTTRKVTGVEINLQGPTIRLRRDSRNPDKDASIIQLDSTSSLTETSTER